MEESRSAGPACASLRSTVECRQEREDFSLVGPCDEVHGNDELLIAGQVEPHEERDTGPKIEHCGNDVFLVPVFNRGDMRERDLAFDLSLMVLKIDAGTRKEKPSDIPVELLVVIPPNKCE